VNPVTRCVRCTSSTPVSFAEIEFVLKAEGVEWRLPLCRAHYDSLTRTIRRWTVNASPEPQLPLSVLHPPTRAPVPSSRNHPAGRRQHLQSLPTEEGVQDSP